MTTQRIKVWDPLVRGLHWSLAAFFLAAVSTGDDFLDLHVFAGYGVGAVLIVRTLWGFVGTPHARFSNFVYRPSVVRAYLKDVASFRPTRYVGHNPAAGIVMLILLISLAMTVLSGLLAYGAMEFSGPLAGWVAGVGSRMAHDFKEAHEFFANLTLSLVGVHLLGVVVAMLQHRENLIYSMFHGYKRPGPSFVEQHRSEEPAR